MPYLKSIWFTLILCCGILPVSSAAQEAKFADAALREIIKNADSIPTLRAGIASAIAPVFARTCGQTTWEGVREHLPDMMETFKQFGLVPTIDSAADDRLIRLFAWGPNIEDHIEKLNPELASITLNFWIAVELVDWETHRALKCEFSAEDTTGEGPVLKIVEQPLLEQLPQAELVASHSAPMLLQKPDVIELRLLQTPDHLTQIRLESVGARVGIVLSRTFR